MLFKRERVNPAHSVDKNEKMYKAFFIKVGKGYERTTKSQVVFAVDNDFSNIWRASLWI
ncbi:hypothetical protein PT2222_140381 [Paraburkholderia tropica]